jgi:hypothetical protein
VGNTQFGRWLPLFQGSLLFPSSEQKKNLYPEDEYSGFLEMTGTTYQLITVHLGLPVEPGYMES